MAEHMEIFEVVHAEKVVFAFARREPAERKAFRMEAEVRPARIEVEERVEIFFHAHRKPAVVVRFEREKVVVRFVPRKAAAPIERAFPVEELHRRARR